jgi:hypothetical protein
MNKELLKEFQLQAGGSHYPDINPAMQARFAELLIQECVDNLFLHGYDDAADQIIKHFGLKNEV